MNLTSIFIKEKDTKYIVLLRMINEANKYQTPINSLDGI